MSISSEKRIEAVESWFRAHNDGEFCVSPSDDASVRSGDSDGAGVIVYTTKNHCLPRILDLARFQQPVAALGRYGLPVNHDLPFVHGSSVSIPRFFIGDADPPDLLILAWLREHLPIEWHGVSDGFLVRHGNRENTGIRIQLSASEMAAVAVLTDLCPDYRELLGPYCSSLLDDGFKIELEGAISESAEAGK